MEVSLCQISQNSLRYKLLAETPFKFNQHAVKLVTLCTMIAYDFVSEC